MGLTMKKILEKFDDCDMFSLTGQISRSRITISEEEYLKRTKKLNDKAKSEFIKQFIVTEKYNITEEEFLNALKKIEENMKEKTRKIYENNKENFINYPNFDELYEEIKQECYDFDCEENRKKYNKDDIGDFFKYSFIADNVGKTTKYGNEYKNFFWHFYYDIASIIDRQKDKKEYCISNGKSPIEQIPVELKEHLLYYEISFSNAVTISGGLMINYFFKLNNETKNYLLNFRNDFELKELDDLTIYKDNKEEFYSCTHEKYNSIELDYKNMTASEILDFINDEYFEEDNGKIVDEINELNTMKLDDEILDFIKEERSGKNKDKVIEIINKLIVMEEGTKFSFKELGISSRMLKNKVCSICNGLNLKLISSEHNWTTISETGNFQKISELPAELCDIEELIEKIK